MILKAWSKGLYANWYYYAPDRLLFDCGEGAALFLRTQIFAIDKVFLSHGHMDHIAGLPALLALRQSTKGDTEKPLTIYYPRGDRSIEIFRDALTRMYDRMIRYDLQWIAIDPGAQVELRKGRRLEAFGVRHPADNPLGFRIVEHRKRLKLEHQGRPGRELAQLSAADKYDYYDGKMFCYSGDSMPLAPTDCDGADLLVHDCTFLDTTERKGATHAAAQEVFDVALAAKVKHLILCHISPRYVHHSIIRDGLAKLDTHDVSYNWISHNRVFEYPMRPREDRRKN